MGYLGRVKPLESIGNVVRSTYTGDASTTTYNLPVAVANEESIIVTINGVTQQDAAYSTNGTQLIFASAPALNDSIEIRCISGVGQGYTPPDGSVTTAKLNSQAVTADKLHNTLDLSGKTVTYGLSGSDLPTGSILQVLQTVKTDTFSTTSLASSPADVTGMSVSITPSSSSNKILVMVNGMAGYGSYKAMFRLVRDSTPISIGDANGNRPRMSTSSSGYVANTGLEQYHEAPFSICYLDSPATTSSTTYKLQMGSYSSSVSVYLNRNEGWQDTANYDPTTASSITVMEIAG